MLKMRNAFALAVLVLLLCSSSRVQAETEACTVISAVPYTISSSAVYCLTTNRSTSITSGSAITINADNVVLDLNGHVLDGSLGGGGTQATGISVVDRKSVTIKNGTVKGFSVGISLARVSSDVSPHGHIVEDMRIERNTAAGLRVTSAAGCTIRNNQILMTGGIITSPIAIVVLSAANTRILDNDIIDALTYVGVPSYGVYFLTATNSLAVGNRLSKLSYGLYFNGGSGNKYRDNLTTNVATPFLGGTDIGGNN